MNGTQPTLVIMAAGMGSRYGGLKQIDPVGPGGEIIIEYSVFDAIKAGFGKVVFIIKQEIESVFKEMVGDKISGKIPVEYAFQSLEGLPTGFKAPEGRVKPWGTAHAVLVAKDLIKTPFAVINADDFYGFDAFQKLHSFLVEEKSAEKIDSATQSRNPLYASCMAGYFLENTMTEHGYVARGVCEVDNDGFLTGITERTRIGYHEGGIAFTEDGESFTKVSTGTVVSMNMFGFPAAFLDEFEPKFVEFLRNKGNEDKSEFLLPTLVNEVLVEGKTDVAVLKTDAKWYGVTYKEDKERVRNAIAGMVSEGLYPSWLW